MAKASDARNYRYLKNRLLNRIGDDDYLVMQINGRIAQLVAEGHSNIGALKRAAIEKKIPLN
jgi:hypothetical protein